MSWLRCLFLTSLCVFYCSITLGIVSNQEDGIVFFAGSGPTTVNQLEHARKLGCFLGNWSKLNQKPILYGGSAHGSMGSAADECLMAGGYLVGVHLPFYESSRHFGLSDDILAATYSQRKFIFYQNAFIFIALPGAIGTVDEVFEVLTTKYLGFHNKRLILYGSQFWSFFDSWIKSLVDKGILDSTVLTQYEITNELSDDLLIPNDKQFSQIFNIDTYFADKENKLAELTPVLIELNSQKNDAIKAIDLFFSELIRKNQKIHSKPVILKNKSHWINFELFVEKMGNERFLKTNPRDLYIYQDTKL